MNLKTLKATFIRNFITQIRAYPKDFFIGNVLTGIYTVVGALFMYKLMFSGALNSSFRRYTGTGDYMSFVIVGTAVYLFVVRTCLNVSRSLITELRTGTLESIMLSPFSRVQYFVGNMLQQLVTTSLEIMVSILIGFAFGLDLSKTNILAFILVFAVSLFGFFALSMILACIMLYFRDTYISQNTLFMLLFLICGISFPYQYLPSFLKVFSKLIPVTDGVNMIRNTTLLGMGIREQLGNILYLIILSSIYTFFGFKLIDRIEYIALEKIEA